MLAQGVDLDVPNHHHALVVFVEDAVPDRVVDGHLITARQPIKGVVKPFRCVAQAITVGVFADPNQPLAHQEFTGRSDVG